MATASIPVFCVPAELDDWLRLLRAEYRLDALVFAGVEDGRIVRQSEDLTIGDTARRIFLFPAEAQVQATRMNDIRARDWGWVDVRPGVVTAGSPRRLLLSEIQGEDFVHEPVHPARFVRGLKDALGKRAALTYGVLGRNVRTGGESVYDDMAYTAGALSLRHEGVEWAQFPEGFVVFEPGQKDDRKSE